MTRRIKAPKKIKTNEQSKGESRPVSVHTGEERPRWHSQTEAHKTKWMRRKVVKSSHDQGLAMRAVAPHIRAEDTLEDSTMFQKHMAVGGWTLQPQGLRWKKRSKQFSVWENVPASTCYLKVRRSR